MEAAESVCREPLWNKQLPIHEEGLTIWAIKGGEFAPDLVEGLGRVVVPVWTGHRPEAIFDWLEASSSFLKELDSDSLRRRLHLTSFISKYV